MTGDLSEYRQVRGCSERVWDSDQERMCPLFSCRFRFLRVVALSEGDAVQFSAGDFASCNADSGDMVTGELMDSDDREGDMSGQGPELFFRECRFMSAIKVPKLFRLGVLWWDDWLLRP